MGVNRFRRAVAALAVACVALSGCGFLAARSSSPGDPGSLLEFLSPANLTAWAGEPVVSVDLRVDPSIDRSTLQLFLDHGVLFEHRVDLTPSLQFAGDHATVDVALADLGEGINKLTAKVPSVPLTDVVFSYEPRLSVADAGACDVLGQPRCALPFPNDRWTTPDASTDTGLRVDFAPGTFPATAGGTPFDPTEWNRNDGFSPGSSLVAWFPGVDLARSHLPTIGTMSHFADPDAGVVVIDTATGERWPVWAELDAWATSDATRALIIHPTRNFLEGHRYVVGLRDLRDAAGNLLPVDREFQVIRDRIPTFLDAVEGRRPAVDAAIDTLHAAGVPRVSLNLAWDFTVASERNLSERVLTMRDDAFASLGGGAPTFAVSKVTDEVSSSVWRRVEGTFDVPLFLTGTGAPGSRLRYGADGLPEASGTFHANFICNVPRSVYAGSGDAVTPGRGLVYGHGLLGGAGEINSFGTLLNDHTVVGCATDWIGMSAGDLVNVAAILGDLSKFPSLPDRIQQGLVNFQFLARLLKDPAGFASNAAFQAGTAHQPVIATGEVFYNGNSQGGILGGAATAISTEWTRAVLGVPGIDFATLLTRSTHWDTFSPVLYAAYPDELIRTVGYSLIQMLWDRGEGDGYAHHLTDDPLPGTPAHTVLLIEAFGDHQVANVATETEARTIGARLWTPALAPGRTDLAEPFFGLEPVPSVPYDGSVLVMWDYGTPAPPQQNLPPRSPTYGSDPHGAGAGEPRVAQQLSDFLRTDGAFTDQCAGGPCQSP